VPTKSAKDKQIYALQQKIEELRKLYATNHNAVYILNYCVRDPDLVRETFELNNEKSGYVSPFRVYEQWIADVVVLALTRAYACDVQVLSCIGDYGSAYLFFSSTDPATWQKK
jgi:hypothetical protein